MKNIRKTFYYLSYLLKILWSNKNGKKCTIAKLLITVISPFVSLIAILVPGLLIDELTHSMRYSKVILFVCLLLVVPYLWNVIQQLFYYYYIDKLRYRLNQKIEADYYKHIAKLDYDFFDKPYLADLEAQANEVVMNDVISSVDSLCTVISTVVGLLTLSTVITKLNPLMIAVIIVNVVINYFISRNQKRKLLEYDGKTKNAGDSNGYILLS